MDTGETGARANPTEGVSMTSVKSMRKKKLKHWIQWTYIHADCKEVMLEFYNTESSKYKNYVETIRNQSEQAE